MFMVSAKKPKRQKFSVVSAMLQLLAGLTVVGCFILLPLAILKITQQKGGVPVVPVDGGQNFISLGPEGKAFIVDVASTTTGREKGLSGRAGLDQSHGMLFIFEQPYKECFWMKDMLFDIDILWFDQDQKLIHIKKEATPASYPAESFCSPVPAKYVIEVAAGTVDRLNLKIGDTFSQP